MSNNVIVFPKSKDQKSPPQTVEEMFEKIMKIREEHTEKTVGEIVPNILNMLSQAGVPVDEHEQQTLNALLIECIRAHIYKSLKLPHPLHDVADQFFVYQEDDNGVTYMFSPNLFDEKEEEGEN